MLFECSIAMQVKILFTTLTTAMENLETMLDDFYIHISIVSWVGKTSYSFYQGRYVCKYIWEKMIRLQARQNEKLEWNQTREIEQILMFEAEL